MYQAWLTRKSFFRQTMSSSMALGSLMACEVEEKKKRDSPCFFLKARI